VKSRRKLIFVLIALACLFLVWEFLWPTYRDHSRRSFAGRAMVMASDLRPVIAERLRKREGGAAINAGLRIAAQPPVTGGYVASDGTVVVDAELDYFVPFTFILRPRLNSKNEVEWTCGVVKQEQTQYTSQQCRRVLEIPDRR